MNLLRDLGKELRNISLNMLDEVEEELKELGIFRYVYDRACAKIFIYSNAASARELLFAIRAVPRTDQIIVQYLKTDADGKSPAYAVARKKNCEKELSLAIRKLQSGVS